MRIDSRGCDHRKPSNILKPFYRQVIEVTVGEAGQRPEVAVTEPGSLKRHGGASDAEC